MVNYLTHEDVEPVVTYLRKRYQEHQQYHRAKYLADELGMPAQRLSQILLKLPRNFPEFDIEVVKYNHRLWKVTKA